MKLAFMGISAIFISACAVNDKTQSVPAIENKIVVQYFEPRNDIQRPIKQAILTTEVKVKESPTGSVSNIGLPLGYAVFCNDQRTSCEHAAVKSSIEFKIIRDTNKKLVLSGKFLTEMGRSKSFEYSLTDVSIQKTTISVPKEVPVISEDKQGKDILLTLTKGERIELNGISGDRVVLSVQ